MAAGYHREHDSVDQCTEIDFSGLQIQPSADDGTECLYDEEAPGLHYAGAIKRYLANLRKCIILIYPDSKQTNTVNYTHKKRVDPFLASFDHTPDILREGVAKVEDAIKNHVPEGNKERFPGRPSDYKTIR